jgi:formate/nitrite transporter
VDYASPVKLVEEAAEVGEKKAKLPTGDLLLRGFLSGVFLGYATSFAFKVSEGFEGGAATLASALVFPVGFAMIVLLGLELVTGNFALLPMSIASGRLRMEAVARNWGWVFLANLIGSVAYGVMLVVSLTKGFAVPPEPLAQKLIAVAEAKTLAYEHAGLRGWFAALIKGILCNWMVTLGTVLSWVSSSTFGKISAIWLPIMTFFALAYEHSVVNMFVIPTAMMLGADISLSQWWVWNQIPVTLGNILGGALFTGLLLYHTYGSRDR